MPVVVQRLTDSHSLGEGPHWDEETKSLYYVDIFGHSIHKYTPSTGTHSKGFVGSNTVSFVVPVKGSNDRYLISLGREIVVVVWDGASDKCTIIERLAQVDTEEGSLENRLNDGKCDKLGRLWCGTMGPEPQLGHIIPDKGSFYSLNSDRTVRSHLKQISCSNGLAWSNDNTKLYYIDSGTREVHQYDFSLSDGKISNKKVIFSLIETGIEGFPDGQTIDQDGNLWVAIFNGYRVIKIDPRQPNTLLQTVEIPAKQVTSVTFGGADLDELYVTSASMTVDGQVLTKPENGAVYRITGLGVKGYNGNRAALS